MTVGNENLAIAKALRNDEFYTRWEDIEREMNAYLEYDPDVFRGKVLLLPCDDPEWSNFTKFFALHFVDFGLKKLVSTSYAPAANFEGAFYHPTPFEIEAPHYDSEKSFSRGRIFILEDKDLNKDGTINVDDLRWDYLEGDGDFRSAEVTALRDEADIIITNPPFSLFREFLAWIMSGGKKFAIIGPANAVTYKEVFPLIRENRLWRGRGFANGDAFFKIPDNAATDYAEGVYDAETGLVHFRNCAWYTNLEHGRRHEPLQLMTMAENMKFSRHKEIRGVGYRRYDNYDAIDVPYTIAIPSDHDGVMGVPISFLEKHNPEQFEILGITKTWDDATGLKTKTYPKQIQVSKNGKRSEVSKLNDGPAIKLDAPPQGTTYYLVGDEVFVQAYARILIRPRKKAQP